MRSLANLVDHLRDRVDLHIVTTDTDYTRSVPIRTFNLTSGRRCLGSGSGMLRERA